MPDNNDARALTSEDMAKLKEYARQNPQFTKLVIYVDVILPGDLWYLGAKTYTEAKETLDTLSKIDGISNLSIIDVHQFWED